MGDLRSGFYELIDCDHEMTLAVSEGDEIAYWRCACGERRWRPPEETEGDGGGESGGSGE